MSEKTEMKDARTMVSVADINFKVGYGKDQTTFGMRMISVAEENEVNEQFAASADLQGAEKDEKEFQVCLNALKRFSDDTTGLSKFNTFNIKNERIVRRAYLMFKSGLEPEASFLPLSDS